MSNSTYYTKKQAAADKALREKYKSLKLKSDRLIFMSTATPGAIYLTNLDTDEGAWYPMLGGFQLSVDTERFAADTRQNAVAIAQGFKEAYQRKLQAHFDECSTLQ